MALSKHIYRGAISAESARRHSTRRLEARGLRPWTAAEDAKLRRTYPDYRAAQKALPHRSYGALRTRAQTLGIRKRRHVWLGSEVKELRRMIADGVTRKQAAQRLGLRLDQVIGAMQQYNIHPPRRGLTRTGNALLDSIRQRAQELNISLADLNRALRTQIFWKNYGRQAISTSLAKRAATILGGRLALEWDPI